MSDEDSEPEVTLEELTEEADGKSVPGACISVHGGGGGGHLTHL